MKKWLLIIFLIVPLTAFGQDKPPEDIVKHLQDVSVTIKAGRSQGSGTIVTRGNTSYIWTAGHVVAGLRDTRTAVDSKTGAMKNIVEFEDAKVVKEIYEDNRSVGQVEMAAEIIRYSNSDDGEDLCLLRLRKKDFFKCSAKFYLDDKNTPPVGTKLYNLGSLLGQFGSGSLTNGLLSQTGRVLDGKIFDQTSCTALPGSSGSGVFKESDGIYVGMLLRGAGENFNFICPTRRMHKYAKSVGVEFAMDESIITPSEEELKKFPIEGLSTSKSSDNSKEKTIETKFLIKIK